MCRRDGCKRSCGFLHSAMGFGLTERDCYRFFNLFCRTLDELCNQHLVLVRKIFDRAFSMYLKPRLKPFKIIAPSSFSSTGKFTKVRINWQVVFNREIPIKSFMAFIKDEELLIMKVRC